MKQDLFTKEAKKNGTIDLPDSLFAGEKSKDQTVKQVILAIMNSKRIANAHTKTRGEVRGGGRKPWKQKGTGRARHGSIRSPIWVGGGTTFGPRNDRNWTDKVNKKVLKQVLSSVMTEKLKNGNVFFTENIVMDKPNTKAAKNILNNFASLAKDLPKTMKNRYLFIVNTFEESENFVLSSRNIEGVSIIPMSSLNAEVAARYHLIIFIGANFDNK